MRGSLSKHRREKKTTSLHELQQHKLIAVYRSLGHRTVCRLDSLEHHRTLCDTGDLDTHTKTAKIKLPTVIDEFVDSLQEYLSWKKKLCFYADTTTRQLDYRCCRVSYILDKVFDSWYSDNPHHQPDRITVSMLQSIQYILDKVYHPWYSNCPRHQSDCITIYVHIHAKTLHTLVASASDPNIGLLKGLNKY